MWFVEQLPSAIRNQLDEEAIYCAQTDLNEAGQFIPLWLIVTANAVSVWDSDGNKLQRLPVSDLRGARTIEAIGGGTLVADTAAGGRLLLSYTASYAAVFEYAAKLITALSAGEALPDAVEADYPKMCPDCGMMISINDSKCPACRSKSSVLLRMLEFAKPYRIQMLIAAALLVVTTLIELIPPYLTKVIVDDVLRPGNMGSALIWLVAGLACTEAVLAVGQIIRGYLGVWIGARMMGGIRTAVYNALMGMSLAYFDRRQTSQFIGRVNQDSESMRQFLTDGLMWVGGNVLKLIAIILVMLSMDWQLTLWAILPMPLIILFSTRIWPKVRKRWYRHWRATFRMNVQVGDSLSGIRVVKAFGQETVEKRRYAEASEEAVVQNIRMDGLWSAAFPIFALLAGTGVLLTWYYGGRAVLEGSMTLGVLMAFIVYLGMFLGPLQWFSQAVNWTNQAFSAADRVFEIVDTPVDVPDDPEAKSLEDVHGELVFDQVSYGYETHRTVLKEVSLSVGAGEMIGLVGHSGAGKSTFINLVCRFYDPSSGSIKLDGIDLRKVKQEDLRRQIGIVLQETFLFDGTIAENIAYAKPDASPIEIMRAAKIANAHDFIVRMPDGYDTRVGERGHRLSGGEKQRVAIARAIVHDPRILILDEATASVDTETERQIQEAIARLVKGRTTIAIAHRLSTLRDANRLIVLERGKVAEVGTHDELLRTEGLYYQLVQAQKEMAYSKGSRV